MIIDFHNHIFDESIAKKAVDKLEKCSNLKAWHNGTKTDLLRLMDESGVDKAVILPIATKPTQTRNINKWAKEISDSRIIPFGTFHQDNENYKEEIDLIAQAGFKGIKLHPDYQGFFVDEERMLPMYDYIFSKGLILIFHCGVDIGLPPPVHCPPERLKNVINKMKGGTLIASHLGAFMMWDDVEKHLVGEDIYLDTSMGTTHYTNEQFLRIVNNHGADKILFGSDSPWSNAKEEIDNLKKSGLSEENLKLIFEKNARKLLGV